MTDVHEDEWLSPAQLGAELQLQTKTLSQWRWRKFGPAYVKVGGLVRYRRSDVRDWLAASAGQRD